MNGGSKSEKVAIWSRQRGFGWIPDRPENMTTQNDGWECYRGRKITACETPVR